MSRCLCDSGAARTVFSTSAADISGVPAELIAVHDERIGHVAHLPTALMRSDREVAVLVVREELGAEPTECVPSVASHQHARAARARDFVLGVVVGGRLLEVPRPADPQEVHGQARRVQQVRAIGQAHARGGDADLVARRNRHELCERVLGHDCVGVDHRHVGTGGRAHADVAPFGEAAVGTVADDRDAGVVAEALHRAVGAAVVDQHHVDLDIGRVERRQDRALEPRLGPVGDGDDGDGGPGHAKVSVSVALD